MLLLWQRILCSEYLSSGTPTPGAGPPGQTNGLSAIQLQQPQVQGQVDLVQPSLDALYTAPVLQSYLQDGLLPQFLPATWALA